MTGCGLYDTPVVHPVLGALWPAIESATKALERKEGIRLLPSGVYAANLLGLSEQVPAKLVFLTDGATRTVKLGPTQISLRRTTPRNMAAANPLSAMLIQAFRTLGAARGTRQDSAGYCVCTGVDAHPFARGRPTMNNQFLAMCFSSASVIANALRLRGCREYFQSWNKGAVSCGPPVTGPTRSTDAAASVWQHPIAMILGATRARLVCANGLFHAQSFARSTRPG
jgi:hypothetical protein